MIIKSKKDKLVRAATFFAGMLQIKDFKLKIKSNKNKECAAWLDQKNHNFTIYADSISSLAHEMVHVKQYLKHDLVQSGNVIFWRGEPSELEDDPNKDAYWLSPWEMEARALSDWLMYNWRTSRCTQKS